MCGEGILYLSFEFRTNHYRDLVSSEYLPVSPTNNFGVFFGFITSAECVWLMLPLWSPSSVECAHRAMLACIQLILQWHKVEI